MDNGFYELLGRYILELDGKIIYNPQFVAKIGRYTQMISKLSTKHMEAAHREYLKKHYQREIDAATFWATYPEDVSHLNRNEKYKLLTKIRHSKT